MRYNTPYCKSRLGVKSVRAYLIASEEYRGQFQFWTDDPYFSMNCPCPELLSEDNHIINRDRVMAICEAMSKVYELSVSDQAVELIKTVLDEKEPQSAYFKTPFEGFQWKSYQKRAINVLEHEDNAMLQMDPGTGKSYTSTMMACQRYEQGRCGKVVVWVPAALLYDWVRTIQEATSLSVAMPNRSWSAKKREEFYQTDDSDVWVLNYERVRTVDREPIEKALKKKQPLFILDEVTKVKNRSSTLHKELAKLSRHCKAKHIALTATPIVRGPEDFYNEFRIIDPDVFGKVKDFERLFTYNCGERDFWDGYVGYQNLSMMHVMTGAQVFSASKTSPEIAKEFPEKNEILLPYRLSERHRGLYDEILDYGYSLGKERRQGALFMLTFMRLCNLPQALLFQHQYDDTEYGDQLRHIDEICRRYEKHLMDDKQCSKLELVLDKIQEIAEAGEKVLVFAQHTSNCLYPLGERLKKAKLDPLFYTGDVSLEDKERVKTAFKTDPKRQVLLMSDAGQMGLNFQECRYLIHYQTPVTHAAYEQRSDRIHRLSSEHSTVDIMRFMGEDTVEERIEDTMQGRRQLATEMGFGEYEEVGIISPEDADWFSGFDD